MNIRCKKIRNVKDGKVEIHFESSHDGENWDEYIIKSHDAPAPDYGEALSALVEDVLVMCEMTDCDPMLILVTGVSFSYGGEGDVMGAVISAQKTLKNSNQPLNLNTPHKTVEFYGEDGDPLSILDGDCVERLMALQTEAIQYIRGKRQQLGLFAEPEYPEPIITFASKQHV